MRKNWVVLAAGCAAAIAFAGAAVAREHVIPVPGFADFIVIDGATVWVTNSGRVENWSRKGKRADVALTHPCGAMTILGDSVWVADCDDGTLNRIDRRTAKRVAVIATGIANPKGELNVVAGAGSVWVASDTKGLISRVDPDSNRVVATVQVDPDTYYLAFGFGSLWAVSATHQVIQKIDPLTNTVVKTTGLGQQPGFLVAGEGAVWVQEQGDGTVARIDPATGDVAARVKVGETLKYGDIDAGGGKVWLRTTADQTFAVIDPETMTVQSRVGKESGSGALRYTATGLWTTAHDRHTLSWWNGLSDTKN